MKKPTKKELQAIETKKKIFNATFQLLKEHAYEEIKIMQIVNKAGVSAGTFYVYYDSKEDVVLNAADIFLQPYQNLINNINEKLEADEQLLYLIQQKNELIKEIGGKSYLKTALGKQIIMRKKPKARATELIFNKAMQIVIKAQANNYFTNKRSASEIIADIALIDTGICIHYGLSNNDSFEKYYILKDYLNSLII
ncbi:TetR/AcrR family transcriptional regulator [Clostridium sp. 'deep sea']|uniref:TetR/AcrR family transcriptional regulator n=1 Tax=Clostridium sp. 'deep sea' TaxID=2779445 RepID=UPI0018969A54|nr:TetR/AcrR family transcriptional regulator [Clostridium sp. 'deep sea']QOR34941.1 TetR/AcrR family transcriptional regulator [Clostridium sp. 'deep sea']